MAKTLVTGATGFIGAHVAQALAARGDDLRLTVRDGSPLDGVQGLDAEIVRADVLDRRAVRRALDGVAKVFHAAGMTSMRVEDGDAAMAVNVGGAKVVLEEALRAGVSRVVMVSGAATFGPAPWGETADENQVFRAGHLGIPWVNSVHEAEAEGLRLAAGGLPIVFVNPAGVLGPGDLHVTSTRLVRSFLLGKIPAYTEGAVGIVDVRDVATGALLADKRGEQGERYILCGRNFTFDRLFADLGRISGVEPPVRVPRGLAATAAGVLELGPGPTSLTPGEVLAASHFWTYRANKANRELGWRARPHEETLEATVAWYMDREHDRIVRTRRSQGLQYRALGMALSAGERAASLIPWPRSTAARHPRT